MPGFPVTAASPADPIDHTGVTMTDATDRSQPVSSIASGDVISVPTNATLRMVVDHLIEEGISLVVVDDGGSVAGVVSEHDILRAIYDGADLDEVWAADIMSTGIATIDPHEPISAAAQMMLHSGIRHLLVLGDEGGVVSIRDVVDRLVE
jgi:CBS domain-containing protein